MICAVTVVPISAPMMMPIDCCTDIKPAETKPTTSTVVTDDDCTTAVVNPPASTAVKRLVVARASMSRSWVPAAAFSIVVS